MNKNIELKDEITLDEYKAWLTGLLHGKGNQLPDLNDWKAIKKMTDKIIETTPWTIPPTYVPPPVFDTPSPNWWENQPMCGTGDIANAANNITISGGSSEINFSDIDDNSGGKLSAGYKTTSKSPHPDEYDTNKYHIISTPSGLNPTNHYIATVTEEHLSAIAKITGMKK